MEDIITAEWARKEAASVLSENVKSQIRRCEKSIKDAVSRNDFTCSVNIVLHDLTITELTKRGFTLIKREGNQREGSFVEITW